MYKQFSPNMLKTFEHCPKMFNFKYKKNISMPVNDEIFEFGKNIHALASYYLRGENINKMEKSLTTREQDVWKYLKSIKYFGYEVVGTEYNLSVKTDGYFFGGRLDALVKNEDRYFILDYKTGSVPNDAKYDFQTIIYILAVKEFFKTNNVSFVYIDLKNYDEVKIDFSTELENEYIKRLISTAKKIELSGEFQKKNNCNCEYSKICF